MRGRHDYLQKQPGNFQLLLQLAAQPPLVMPQGVVQVDSGCAVRAYIIDPFLHGSLHALEAYYVHPAAELYIEMGPIFLQ